MLSNVFIIRKYKRTNFICEKEQITEQTNKYTSERVLKLILAEQ